MSGLTAPMLVHTWPAAPADVMAESPDASQEHAHVVPDDEI